jgi:glutathione S-transferase
MQLYDHPLSPYAFKVRAALYEKGLAFEKCEIQRHEQRAKLLELNPRGEVPVLVDGDVVVADSKVICGYLEDKFPQLPLVPSDPALRARCRTLELKSDTDIDACLFVLALLKVTRVDIAAAHPEALDLATALLESHYALLERELGGREWFLGEFSLVDIALAPHLRLAAFLGYRPNAQQPALDAWLERIRQRASIRQASKELAKGFADSNARSDGLFDFQRLHWRNDRIEYALRCGLGPWLLGELQADRAFFSPLLDDSPSRASSS